MTPFRPRLAAALVTVLTLTLGGCAMGTTAPASARADAASDAKGSFGQVDCRKAKCIALTFDAGPAKDTPRLLDVLKEKRVPATFFLLGRDHVLKHPETVRRIEDEGTVPAVPGIIDTLKERGYTFVTVPQLMAPAEPRPGTVYRP